MAAISFLIRKEKKQILGHSDIKNTMRYAYFAPVHLDDAITKNTIAGLLGKNEMAN